VNNSKGFHAFTIKGNGLLDRIITDIEVMPAFDPNKPTPAGLQSYRTKALWDTGASKSVLSTSVVQKLGLTPIGKCQVHHGDGESERNTYVVNFRLPNTVGFAGMVVTDFPPSHNSFEVLVGMDVIRHGDLSISNVGDKTCISFRTPSIECVDYVADANAMVKANVGRNDPCPCGKGKKFKKCCGATL
jgi:hypothetical protein